MLNVEILPAASGGAKCGVAACWPCTFMCTPVYLPQVVAQKIVGKFVKSFRGLGPGETPRLRGGLGLGENWPLGLALRRFMIGAGGSSEHFGCAHVFSGRGRADHGEPAAAASDARLPRRGGHRRRVHARQRAEPLVGADRSERGDDLPGRRDAGRGALWARSGTVGGRAERDLLRLFLCAACVRVRASRAAVRYHAGSNGGDWLAHQRAHQPAAAGAEGVAIARAADGAALPHDPGAGASVGRGAVNSRGWPDRRRNVCRRSGDSPSRAGRLPGAGVRARYAPWAATPQRRLVRCERSSWSAAAA